MGEQYDFQLRYAGANLEARAQFPGKEKFMPSKGRPSADRERGHYAVDNGTIAIVEPNGDRLIAEYTPELQAQVCAAGYTEGQVYVPQATILSKEDIK